MAKITKITQDTVTLPLRGRTVQTVTRLRLMRCDMLVELTAKGEEGTVSGRVCLMEGTKHWKAMSKHAALILMRSLAAQRELPQEGTLCLNQGRIFMNLSDFLLLREGWKGSHVQMYHRNLDKNIKIFEKVLLHTGTILRRTRLLSQPWSQPRQSLHLSEVLRKTQTNIGISQTKSEFMFANRSFAEQSEQLSEIQENILSGEYIEETTKQLYTAIPKEITGEYLRMNLVPAFQSNIKRLGGLLLPKEIRKKTMEDYNYNVIKVIDVGRLDRDGVSLLGEGATSHVFEQRIKMVYVWSSQGFFSQVNNEEVVRTVAVKRQRQGLESRRDKLAHERQIVAKLKNSSSIYLPKYFGLPVAPPCAPELSSCLLMQKLQGEQLDLYASMREQTISLPTKLQLLLNIIQGLRHLHGCGIVHLDVKPFNIIVTRGRIPKIIDFGDAYHRQLCPKSTLIPYQDYLPGFSFPWVAPEVCLRSLRFSLKREDGLQFSEKQDVFAFGFIMGELLFKSRVLSLSQQRFQQVYTRRQVLTRVFLSPERGVAYGEELVSGMLMQLMVRCMDGDPGGRPRAEWIGIALRLMINSLLGCY